MIHTIVAAELIVKDLEGCTAFYRDVLGLRVHETNSDSTAFALGDLYFFLLEAARAAQMISEEPLDLTSGGPSRSLLAASVDDVDAMYADLKAKGVHMLRPPADQHWGLRTAYFTDPEGNFWEIHQSVATQTGA